MGTSALFDTVRTLAFGSISGTYAAVGTPTTQNARIVAITNNTNGHLLFSVTGTTDQIFVASSSYILLDLTTNRQNGDPTFLLPIHTQFYVKQVTAPSSGDVYIAIVYG